MRSLVFLKPFTRVIIEKIVKECKFQDKNSLISDYFGLASETEIQIFSDWLFNITVGFPRALKTTLDHLLTHRKSHSEGDSMIF